MGRVSDLLLYVGHHIDGEEKKFLVRSLEKLNALNAVISPSRITVIFCI